MKQIILLRHAKSSWDDAELDDLDRPLNARGEKQGPAAGLWLRENGWVPDLILASHALRAQQTAYAVAQSCGYSGPILTRPALYRTDASAYREVVRAVLDRYQRVMLVGHNPEIEEFLATLIPNPPPLKTATLAVIALPIEHWSDLKERPEGKLLACFKPTI